MLSHECRCPVMRADPAMPCCQHCPAAGAPGSDPHLEATRLQLKPLPGFGTEASKPVSQAVMSSLIKKMEGAEKLLGAQQCCSPSELQSCRGAQQGRTTACPPAIGMSHVSLLLWCHRVQGRDTRGPEVLLLGDLSAVASRAIDLWLLTEPGALLVWFSSVFPRAAAQAVKC